MIIRPPYYLIRKLFFEDSDQQFDAIGFHELCQDCMFESQKRGVVAVAVAFILGIGIIGSTKAGAMMNDLHRLMET